MVSLCIYLFSHTHLFQILQVLKLEFIIHLLFNEVRVNLLDLHLIYSGLIFISFLESLLILETCYLLLLLGLRDVVLGGVENVVVVAIELGTFFI